MDVSKWFDNANVEKVKELYTKAKSLKFGIDTNQY